MELWIYYPSAGTVLGIIWSDISYFTWSWKVIVDEAFLEKIWIVKFVPNQPQFIVSKDLAHEAPCERFMYVQYNLRLF